MTESERKCARY